MNKDNNKYEANPNGVRYVNTTHDEFITMMRDKKKKGLPVFFNLSTQKVDEYLCDLGPAPDDANKDWGCVYQFPHYLIHSPLYRIEPDMDDDMVDITPICAYNESTTVLISKKDMSKPGFKRFILDSCDSIIALLNSLKIPVTKDPENVAAYCQMMTMIQFINRYNKYIHIFNSCNFKDVLVHSLDHNYRVYRIAIIPEDGSIRGDDTISYYDKNLNENVNKNVDVINDKDDASVYPTAKQPIAVDIDEDKLNDRLRKHVKRLSRAKFIRSMMKDENFKQALCADWPKYLEGLIDLFNDEIKDGCPIKNAWDTSIGKIIKEFVDFIYDNVVYICELRQEDDVTFTIKVNKQYQLELLVGVYEETYHTKPGDNIDITPIDEELANIY